jgi:spermidine synthase
MAWLAAGHLRAAGAVVAAGALLTAVAAPADARIIHEERSLYSSILINRQGPMLCLQFSVRRDQRNQSCVNQRRPREMVFVYARMVMTSLLLEPEPGRILILGLGGGTLPMAFDELLPQADIDIVEIDPAVVRVAREYFGFAPSDRVDVFAQDGRVFVKRKAHQREQYDLVILDAFNGEYIPEHLMTREFLQEVQQLLAPGGVLVANTFSISELYDHESATYADVFGRFYNLRADETGNRVIITRNGPLPSSDDLEQRADALQPALEPYGVDYDRLLPLMSTEVDWDANARVLTDQFSPANLLRNQ